MAIAARPPYKPVFFHNQQFHVMANTTSTPKHTDPATKTKEKENEVEVKDKPSGKTVKTQKK